MTIFSLKHLILSGLILFVVGLIAGRKLPKRFRLAWIVPALLLLGVAAYQVIGKREDNRQARQLFERLETGHTLSPNEAEAVRALASAPARVREQVLELAFASTNNAAIALPRLGFLLHCCLELEPAPALPMKIWRDTVMPAIKARPSTAIFRIAAATADYLRLGSNEVGQVAGPLLAILQNEPDPSARLLLIKELSPLADRMQPPQTRILAESLLRALSEEKNQTEYGTLTSGLMLAVNQFDSEWAQRTISQALSLLETNKDSFKSAALVKGLAQLRGQMNPEQLQRTAYFLANGWLESNGQVKPGAVDLLPEFVKLLPPEEVEKLVLLALGKMESHSASIFYQSWTKALTPFLKESAARMGAERTAAIVSSHFEPVREPWSDILWGRLMTPLLSGRPVEEAAPLAQQLLEKTLLTRGQARVWSVERFSALAERLQSADAKPMADRILDQLTETEDSYEFDALVSCLVRLADRLDEASANEIAQCLLAAMDPAQVVKYLALARVLDPLSASLEPATAERAIFSLLGAMNRGKNIYRMSLLAQRFAPLAADATPDQIRAVIERLVGGLEAEKDLDGIVVIAPGLAALADHMDPAQGSRVGEILLRGLEQEPVKLFLAGKAIDRLANQMSPDQSKRGVEMLLKRGLGRGGPELYWAQKAPSVAGGLTPELAENLVQELTASLSRERDPNRIYQRIRATIPFASGLRPDQVHRLGNWLLQTVEDTNSFALARLLVGLPLRPSAGWSSPRSFIAHEEETMEIHALRGLCEALATLLPRMNEQDASEIAGRLAWRFQQQGWFKPLPYDSQLAEALRYAPEQSLANILKTPFAVGGLRQTTLRALELKTAGGARPQTQGARASNSKAKTLS
jgi:hypothetical protein